MASSKKKILEYWGEKGLPKTTRNCQNYVANGVEEELPNVARNCLRLEANGGGKGLPKAARCCMKFASNHLKIGHISSINTSYKQTTSGTCRTDDLQLLLLLVLPPIRVHH